MGHLLGVGLEPSGGGSIESLMELDVCAPDLQPNKPSAWIAQDDHLHAVPSGNERLLRYSDEQ